VRFTHSQPQNPAGFTNRIAVLLATLDGAGKSNPVEGLHGFFRKEKARDPGVSDPVSYSGSDYSFRRRIMVAKDFYHFDKK
jgi:hypothetical protein